MDGTIGDGADDGVDIDDTPSFAWEQETVTSSKTTSTSPVISLFITKSPLVI